MKKVLFATTALVLSAGFASADVSISGYGRFGAMYDSSRDNTNGDISKTYLEQRFRLNIDAKTTTDDGIEFGGRVRLQFDDGDNTTETAPAVMYVSYAGLRVEVGNVNTAIDYDAVGTFYGSELGLTATSFGDSRTNFWYYTSSAYDTDQTNRAGVNASYTIDGFTAMASYIDPDQKMNPNEGGLSEESSLYLAYVTGPITLSAGAVWNGAGQDDNNMWFVGGKYAFNDQFTAGLNYIDEGKDTSGEDLGSTTTVYGAYTMDAVTLQAYIANNDYDDNDSDTTYGLGAGYDLGGGTQLLASVERGYGSESADQSAETTASLGVKFKF